MSLALTNVDQCILSFREVVHNLHLSVIDTFGLAAVIKKLLKGISQKRGIDLQYCIDSKITFPALKEIHEYGVFNKLINNTLKHSGTSKITVELSSISTFFYQLSVADNDIGISKEVLLGARIARLEFLHDNYLISDNMDKNITISIIEDHPMYIIGLNNLIAPHDDFSIIATGQTVSEGKIILQQHQPDILLLDIDLPDGKGIRLLDYITDWKLKTRVIIISTYYDYIHIQLAEERGASGYLSKNSDAEKIISAIYTVAKGQRFFEMVKSSLGVAEKISKREKQILELLSEGKSRIAISESLFICNETLKSHIKNLLIKTNTNSVTELISGYLRSKI